MRCLPQTAEKRQQRAKQPQRTRKCTVNVVDNVGPAMVSAVCVVVMFATKKKEGPSQTAAGITTASLTLNGERDGSHSQRRPGVISRNRWRERECLCVNSGSRGCDCDDEARLAGVERDRCRRKRNPGEKRARNIEGDQRAHAGRGRDGDVSGARGGHDQIRRADDKRPLGRLLAAQRKHSPRGRGGPVHRARLGFVGASTRARAYEQNLNRG